MCLCPFHQRFRRVVVKEQGRTYGEEPFLLSEDGNRKTNFAGWVNEQFEIPNVTGTLQDLDTEISKWGGVTEQNHLP